VLHYSVTIYESNFSLLLINVCIRSENQNPFYVKKIIYILCLAFVFGDRKKVSLFRNAD